MEGQQSRKIYPTQGMGAMWRRMFPYKYFYGDIPITALSQPTCAYTENDVAPTDDVSSLVIIGPGEPAAPPFAAGAVAHSATVTGEIGQAPKAASKAAIYQGGNGLFVDDTANAGNVAANDMVLLTAGPDGNDFYMLGDVGLFDCVVVNLGTAGLDHTLDFEYSVDGGAVTGGGLNSLIDGGKAWAVDSLVGCHVVLHNAAGPISQQREIQSNNGTTIVPTAAFDAPGPVIGDRYMIWDNLQTETVFSFIDTVGNDLTHWSYVGKIWCWFSRPASWGISDPGTLGAGFNIYWIRFKVDSFAGGYVQPLGNQAWLSSM